MNSKLLQVTCLVDQNIKWRCTPKKCGSGVLFSQVTFTSEVWQPEIQQLTFPNLLALYVNQ